MQSYLSSTHYDLVTPDGAITSLKTIDPAQLEVELHIQNISPAFVGFQIPRDSISFNLKSTLAQLGLDGTLQNFTLDAKNGSAKVQVRLKAYGKIATALIFVITHVSYIVNFFYVV
jgi:hypothetical protein